MARKKAVTQASTETLEKANYEINLANKRLSELEELKSENRLSTSTEEEIKTSYNKHTIDAQEKINQKTNQDGDRRRKDRRQKVSENLNFSLEHAKQTFGIKENDNNDNQKPEKNTGKSEEKNNKRNDTKKDHKEVVRAKAENKTLVLPTTLTTSTVQVETKLETKIEVAKENSVQNNIQNVILEAKKSEKDLEKTMEKHLNNIEIKLH
jgi:hypothetical protein